MTLRDGGMVGWWDGGMVGWWDGGMVDGHNGARERDAAVKLHLVTAHASLRVLLLPVLV